MTGELPKGWAWSTCDEAGDVSLGRQRSPRYHSGSNMRPYLRVANVFEDRIDTSDVMEMHFEPAEFDQYKLRDGDVLLNEGQSPHLLGRPAIYRGIPAEIAYTNSLIRFRAHPGIDPRWALTVFRHHMHSGRFARESRITTNIAHLSAKRFAGVEFPVPPTSEQQRIVAELERRLSHVDAAVAGLDAARRKAAAAKQSIEHQMLWKPAFEPVRLGDLLTPPGLINGHSVTTRAGGFPVLRLTCLGRSRVDLTASKEGDWSAADAERFLVEEGDFLVARGNGSLALVGRGGLVGRVENPVAFPDTLIRVRVQADRISPEYLAAVWNSPGVRRQLEAVARTTAGIFKVNQGHLREVLLPVPDISDQPRLVEELGRRLSLVEAAERSIALSLARAVNLRRSLLAAAFSGQLVTQDPDDEPAAVLLDRVRAEQGADVPSKTKRTKNKETVA